MKTNLLRVCVILALAALPASAEIIGVEQFDYPDGAIAGRNSGAFWDYKNTSPTGHTGVKSNWDDIFGGGSTTVINGRLVTNTNGWAKREYNGNTETTGAINDVNVAKAVYARVTVTTGATLPNYFGLASYDFGAERMFLGKRVGSGNFGYEIVGGASANGPTTVPTNSTFTLVFRLDFVADGITLFLNPDFRLPMTDPANVATVVANAFYGGTNWSTALRLASGTGGSPIEWDDLVIATTWEDLGTVVTTTADEDDGSLGGGTGVSLREAVKYAPSGALITFAPALSGQTCTLTHADGDMDIPGALTIDASALPGGFTVDGNNTHRHFDVESGKSLTLRGLTLTRGNSIAGGAIYSEGTLRADHCSFSENTAGDIGGAISVFLGTAELSRCTLSANTASDAGAVWMQGSATTVLSHCTVTGNRSTGGSSAGGMVVLNGTLTLQHCTVSQNTGNGFGGGLFLQSPATVNVQTSIIAGNADSSTRPDIYYSGGTLNASGTSLIGNNTSVEAQFPAGPLVGTTAAPLDPKLSPIGHFGGPVQTMHPLIGSLAIDTAGTTDPGGTDARGFIRFEDGNQSFSSQLDIGAVEAGGLTTVTTTVDENNGLLGGTSLREAIGNSTAAGRRINFITSQFPGTITLGLGELAFPATPGLFMDASNLTGTGVTISGGNASRVFNIPATATVAMHSLRIVDGKTTGLAAGGGILNAGTCTVMSSTLSGNVADGDGGGIHNSGICLVRSSTLSGNSADAGDGGGIDNDGTCVVISSTLSGNAANFAGFGGGIYNGGTCSVLSSTLSGNMADDLGGGGIFNASGRPFHLAFSIVSGNTAPVGPDIDGFVAPGPSNFIGGSPLLAPLGDRGGRTQTMALLQGSPARNAASPVSEVQLIDIGAFPVSYTLTFKGATTTTLTETSTAAQVQAALEALATIGAGNVSVAQFTPGGPNILFLVTFTGGLAHSDQPFITDNGVPVITSQVEGRRGSRQRADQRDFPMFGAPDIGAYEAQLGTIANATIPANSATSAQVFTVGQIGVLTAASGNPTLIPNASLSLGGSGANRSIAYTPAADQYGTAVITVTDSLSGESQSFTLTVTPILVTDAGDSGPGTLRQALLDAAAISGPNLIAFDPALSGQTLTLGSELVISDANPVTIDASTLPGGITLDGNNATRHFRVTAGKTLTLRGLTLTGGNGTTGGAISNEGTLQLERCTLTGNRSSGDAGALFNSNGTATLAHCTFAGNFADRGGAIFNPGGTISLVHCTLSGNTAAVISGAILNQDILTLTNSIVSGNAAPSKPDLSQTAGSLTTTGVNFIGNLAGSTLTAGPAILTGDAKLSPLGHFGGPVQTMHPLIGSPAIDAAGTTNPGGTDARGFPRFVDGNDASAGAQLDIGAVEAGLLFKVQDSGDGGGATLRNTLALINSTTIQGLRVAFDPALFPASTITLAGANQLTAPAGKAIFMDASNLSAPVTISANNASRVLNIPATATVAMHSLRIVNGQTSGADDGAGILNTGTCTAIASTFSGNHSSDHGGAIAHHAPGTLLLSHCTLSQNSAVQTGGAIYSDGTLTLTHSTLCVNQSNNKGGAIFNHLSSLTLRHCTISFSISNTSAVFNEGTLTLENSILFDNGGPSPGKDLNNSGTVTRSGANIIGSVFQSGSESGPPAINADPLLAPLGDYGGPTQTMALRTGSPARNAGAPSARRTDQRGFPVVGLPDLGAYEAGTLLPNYNAYIWETLPNTATPAEHAAASDYDHDGTSNELEWLAGTSAADPASAFRLTVTRSGSDLVITFPTIVGRTYFYQRSDDLTPASWTTVVASARAGTGSPESYTLPTTSPPRRFFRVIIQ